MIASAPEPCARPTELAADLADFMAALGESLSPATLDAYRRDLEAFARHFELHELNRVEDISESDIRAFAAAEHRRGLNPRSIQRRLSALRRFFRFMRERGKRKDDPTQGVRAPKVRRRLPEALDIDQVLALLEIPEDGDLSIRDRAMLELFYGGGLRLAELASLEWSRVDLGEGMVRVLGKGRKERLIPIGRQAVASLKRWRSIHAALVSGASGEVFTSLSGKPLTTRAIQKRVAFWSQRQGLDQRVHPHQLRHSFASHILESSGDLRAVQELLGHANLSTTQIYTHLDFQHLAKVYDQAHPRAKKPRE